MTRTPSVMSALFVVVVACQPLAVRHALDVPNHRTGDMVVARGGMVVSAERHASWVGREVIASGGNAVDAAVATAFALAVTYPRAGNLGGGGFMVVRLADGTRAALDFRETAPAAATRDMYLDASGELGGGSRLGVRAAGVPGSVMGLWEAHQRFGSQPWHELVAPAIRLAEKGIPIDKGLWNSLQSLHERLRSLTSGPYSLQLGSTRRVFGREALSYGVLRQPELARTLHRIAAEGAVDFYRGETAELLLETMQRHGGLITRTDLAQYTALWREPLTFSYRDHLVVSMPPSSSGGATMAEIANILEGYPLGDLAWGGADHVHLLAEACKRAYVDRNAYLGDPDFESMPLERMLSDEYAAERRAQMTLASATASGDVLPGLGTPSPAAGSTDDAGETTHFSIVDAAGNAVAVTTTLNSSFGSLVTVAGAGFLLNNEMDDFAVRPGAPNLYGLVQGEVNAIEGGKRMLSSMSPSIVVDPQGRLFMVTGTPGGSRIISVTWQTIANAIDFGFDVAAIVAAPRVHHQHLPDVLWFEPGGLTPAILDELRGRGHELREREPFCDVQVIRVAPDGTATAASDPRGSGAAFGVGVSAAVAGPAADTVTGSSPRSR